MNAPTSLHPSASALRESFHRARSAVDLIALGRGIVRAARMLGVFTAAAVHFGMTVLFASRRNRLRDRARWLHRWSRHLSRTMGLRVGRCGDAPASGMIVSNHLSYLDILAFGSIAPCLFVAKQEVAGWPVFGFFARLAGTIFVNRASRMQVAEANVEIEAALRGGALVVLFAEGTSSDGRSVLPFRPALLEPAIRSRSRVTPAAVAYSIADGSVAEEVCYWRDMTLLPHLLNLLTKRAVCARIGFGDTVGASGSRKDSAVRLREEVARLHRLLEILAREVPVCGGVPQLRFTREVKYRADRRSVADRKEKAPNA